MWYGHVHLLPSHVVGQWFCVDRESGELSWQRTMFRPNTICGVDSGVIVASEMRSDDPWMASFGCYGISLENGKLLWTSHRNGFWGRITRLLDFVPGFTNELRDTAQRVQDGKVFFQNGRVVEIKTGQPLQRFDREIVQSHQKQATMGSRFYSSGIEKDHPRISIGNGVFLRHAQTTPGFQSGVLKIAAETEAGELIWLFSPDQLSRRIDGNFYSYRLVLPFLYLVVSDESRYKPHPTQEHCILPNPTRWHFVTVDLVTGRVVQDFSLGDELLKECRIEDVDDHGLLIGKSSHSLVYYQRNEPE